MSERAPESLWEVFDARFSSGHSLGEYSALTAAGVISFEDGMNIIKKRGEFMAEDANQRQSRLLAIAGWSEEQAEDFCEEFTGQVALINSPTNVVIGCPVEDVEDLSRIVKERKARATLLSTAGAFHTDFFRSSADKLADVLEGVAFKDLDHTFVVSNLTGSQERLGEKLKANTIAVMTAPVRWAYGIRHMYQQGATFVEIGPGRSLEALNRQNMIPAERTKNIAIFM